MRVNINNLTVSSISLDPKAEGQVILQLKLTAATTISIHNPGEYTGIRDADRLFAMTYYTKVNFSESPLLGQNVNIESDIKQGEGTWSIAF